MKKSFADTQTVSEFLAKRQMMPGSVVIVDEAAQIGGNQCGRDPLLEAKRKLVLVYLGMAEHQFTNADTDIFSIPAQRMCVVRRNNRRSAENI